LATTALAMTGAVAQSAPGNAASLGQTAASGVSQYVVLYNEGQAPAAARAAITAAGGQIVKENKIGFALATSQARRSPRRSTPAVWSRARFVTVSSVSHPRRRGPEPVTLSG
jgi:hypothetical protein